MYIDYTYIKKCVIAVMSEKQSPRSSFDQIESILMDLKGGPMLAVVQAAERKTSKGLIRYI